MFKRSRIECYKNATYPSYLPPLPVDALPYVFIEKYSDEYNLFSLPVPLIKAILKEEGYTVRFATEGDEETIHLKWYICNSGSGYWTNFFDDYTYGVDMLYKALEDLIWANYDIVESYTSAIILPSGTIQPIWQTLKPRYYDLNNSNWKDCRPEYYSTSWK